jgi:predicted HicB family RNase H-like nuclease
MPLKIITIRLPDDLHAAVKADAEAEHRSFNSHIIWLLEARVAAVQAAK